MMWKYLGFFIGICLNEVIAQVDYMPFKPVDPRSCCPLPDFETAELKEKCEQFDIRPLRNSTSSEMFDNRFNNSSSKDDDTQRHHRHHHHHRRHHHHHHHHHPCFYSCVFNETEIFMNNILDEDKLREYLERNYKESTELQSILAESFNTCAAKVADLESLPRPSSPPPPGFPSCELSAGWLMGCVFKNTFAKCPTSMWNDTEQCKESRDYFLNRRPNSN